MATVYRESLEGANFSIKLMEELNFEAPIYVTAHKFVCKLICLIFKGLMVTSKILKLKAIQKFPAIQ